MSTYRSLIGRGAVITVPEFRKLREITNCQCCEKVLIGGGGPGVSGSNTRQLDHCHSTGVVRGVLCWDCNVGIGKLGDTKEGVQRALDYLKGG